MLLLFIEQLSLLPFPFDLRHHVFFTDEQQLRKVHGIFTDLRTYDNYGHFTEYSRNFHGLTDEQQLRIFHGTFTDLRTNGNYEFFSELLRTYECHGTVRE